MKFDILSLFPDFIEAFFDHSIIKRAIESGRVEMAVTDPRTFSKDKHHHVDDTIYGGGAGMLMQCGPLFDAVESVLPEKGPRDRVIFLSPAGQTFTQDKAKQLYRDYDHLVLICGHYEGVDHRVEEYLADELISIGDYVLTGGELGAMVIADAVSRMIPGVLGDSGSAIYGRKLFRRTFGISAVYKTGGFPRHEGTGGPAFRSSCQHCQMAAQGSSSPYYEKPA